MRNRICYYIMEDQRTDDGHYIPSLVQENSAGHSPVTGGIGGVPYRWGTTYEGAQRVCDSVNEGMGLSRDDVMEIVASSLRSSLRAQNVSRQGEES